MQNDECRIEEAALIGAAFFILLFPPDRL